MFAIATRIQVKLTFMYNTHYLVGCVLLAMQARQIGESDEKCIFRNSFLC